MSFEKKNMAEKNKLKKLFTNKKDIEIIFRDWIFVWHILSVPLISIHSFFSFNKLKWDAFIYWFFGLLLICMALLRYGSLLIPNALSLDMPLKYVLIRFEYKLIARLWHQIYVKLKKKKEEWNKRNTHTDGINGGFIY